MTPRSKPNSVKPPDATMGVVKPGFSVKPPDATMGVVKPGFSVKPPDAKRAPAK
ncbi:MAG: hypothetical protein ABSD44_02135 [Terracidiphilus sp.]